MIQLSNKYVWLSWDCLGVKNVAARHHDFLLISCQAHRGRSFRHLDLCREAPVAAKAMVGQLVQRQLVVQEHPSAEGMLCGGIQQHQLCLGILSLWKTWPKQKTQKRAAKLQWSDPWKYGVRMANLEISDSDVNCTPSTGSWNWPLSNLADPTWSRTQPKGKRPDPPNWCGSASAAGPSWHFWLSRSPTNFGSSQATSCHGLCSPLVGRHPCRHASRPPCRQGHRPRARAPRMVGSAPQLGPPQIQQISRWQRSLYWVKTCIIFSGWLCFLDIPVCSLSYFIYNQCWSQRRNRGTGRTVRGTSCSLRCPPLSNQLCSPV